ncbi:NUDIX hydrolase [Lichenibacterium ramalinae]|uniref:NUDIX hydrolase n=1 Tax=Lichenibacterium ramalinae TaxID=2316527 RepID=UPI0013EE26FA|nr:NUDIX domain-containing protein [Lichenibacterium ramalinae]
MNKPKPLKARKQVAALPVRLDAAGRIQVLLITSRETKRLIVPKGWPMKGRKDYRAAAIEAQEEAGLIGRVAKKPIGTYTYWKRRPEHFDLCRVKVYILAVERQLPTWREKGQRQGAWFLVDDAADLVDDAGLVTILRKLGSVWPGKGTRKAAAARARAPVPT